MRGRPAAGASAGQLKMKLSLREAALHAFIAAAVDQPSVWGVSDCSSWAARWVETIAGRAPQLPTYASRAEAHALIDAAGGLDRLWEDALAPIGIHPTTAPPALGDVAICETRKFGPVGLIMAHGGVGYWRAESGVHALAPRTLVKVWSVA